MRNPALRIKTRDARSGSGFMAGSVIFHAVILIAALMLPSPFPSVTSLNKNDLTYVEMKEVPGTTGEEDEVPLYKGVPAEPGMVKLPVKAGLPTAPPKSPAQAAPKPAGQHKPAAPSERKAAAQPPAPQPVAPPAPSKSPAPGSAPAPSAPSPVPQATGLIAAGSGDTVKSVSADRGVLAFKYQKGWPVPGMVRVNVDARGVPGGGAVTWRAKSDEKWVILSPSSGIAPSTIEVGVDTSKMALGYYDAKVSIEPESGIKGDDLTVTVMVLPKEAGSTELPHSSYDSYMNGECKVCHLPKELMPGEGFMLQTEFCGLCHNPSGMAKDVMQSPGGHPVLIPAGSGGTKRPSRGRIASGQDSDRMDTHLKDGKLVVCVTCHNVMKKPGDYGRTWEMAASSDRRTFYLYKGGWKSMGYLAPKVYVTDGLTPMPKHLVDVKKYLVDEPSYGFDAAEGSVTFKAPRTSKESVYVTLYNPYLRVSTENNALCFDCHSENTHEGMNCLTCHRVHGGGNIMCIRPAVRTPEGRLKSVSFRAKKGEGSFATGKGVGICEVCHAMHRHKDGKDYTGADCTRCHSHRNGFSPSS